MGKKSLEEILPRLLEKVLERGQRAVVYAGSSERVEALDSALWTYKENSFLPHSADLSFFPEQQPIFLTDTGRNPNGAQVLFLVDGASTEEVSGYERVFYLLEEAKFSGNSCDELHEIWCKLKEQGHDVLCWKTDQQGRWIQQEVLR